MAAEGSSFDLIQVVSLLGAAVVAVPLFKRLGLGSVLGYLAAGLAIGPYGLALVTDSHAIIHIAEFGVVMFLFVIGLEMKPSHLWGLRRQIFGLGSLQVVVSAILLTLVGVLFGAPWAVSFICASGFVLTSTAIVMQVLGERQELASPRGQRIVSILLFEDLLIVPLLALVAFLAPATPESAAHATPLWQTIGTALLSLAALVAAGLWVLNPLFRVLAASRAREVMTAAALLVVLGAGLLMETGGLSMAMGAFVAGVLLSESSFRHQLEADIEPFRGLLLGLFFITVGAGVDFELLAHQGWKILGITLCVIVAKGLILLLLGKVFRLKRLDQKLFALALAQAGEFGFVLLSLVESNGVMPSHIAKQLLLAVALSMLFTPLLFILYDKVMVPRAYARAKAGDAVRPDVIEQKHPVIIAGHGRFGRVINAMVTACGYKTTVIDHNAATVAGYKRFGVETYFGDASRQELLLIAGLAEARLLVVAIDNHEQAMKITEFARKTNPGIKIVARSYDAQQTYELYHAGADEIVRENFDSAVRCGKRALECLGMPKLKAEEVGNLYFHRNRHGMAMAAKAYDPSIGMFENKALIEIVRAEMAETERLIRQLLHDQAISWPKDVAETTTEHGDMNMQEPVEGG